MMDLCQPTNWNNGEDAAAVSMIYERIAGSSVLGNDT